MSLTLTNLPTEQCFFYPLKKSAPVVKVQVSPEDKSSQTATGFYHHVPVFFQDDIVVVVIEEDRNWTELGGSAARLRNLVRLQEVDLSGQSRQTGSHQQCPGCILCRECVGTDHLLNEGVVGGVHAGAQRVKTLAITVVRRVSRRGQDPVLGTTREDVVVLVCTAPWRSLQCFESTVSS